MDVDRVNSEQLAHLPGEAHTYRARDAGSEPELTMLQKNCQAPELLVLKEATQVRGGGWWSSSPATPTTVEQLG